MRHHRSLEISRNLITSHAEASKDRSEPLGINCHSYALATAFQTVGVPDFQDLTEAAIVETDIPSVIPTLLDYHGTFVTPQKQPKPNWLLPSFFAAPEPPPSKFVALQHDAMLKKVAQYFNQGFLTTYHILQKQKLTHSGVVAPQELQVPDAKHLYDINILERPNSVWFSQHAEYGSWNVTYRKLEKSIQPYRHNDLDVELWFVPWTQRVIEFWSRVLAEAEAKAQDQNNLR